MSREADSREPGSPWRLNSVASRIVVTTTLLSLGALALVLTLSYFLLHEMLTNAVDSSLKKSFRDVAASVTVDDSGKVSIHEPVAETTQTEYWVFSKPSPSQPTLHVVGSSLNMPLPPVAVSLRTTTTPKRVDGDEFAYLGGPVVKNDNRAVATLVVAERLRPYETSRNSLLIGLALAGLVATVGAALVSRWTVRRTLRPVGQMAKAAEEWSDQSIYTRFEVDGSSDEFVALGRTLNRLMDRVTNALHNEQRLTSEVAHELKTPLTVIRAEAELSMLEARDPQVHQRLERIIEQIQTMTHSITALVQIARDQDQQDTATVDEAVASVVDSFAPPDGIHLTPNVVAGGGLLVPRDSLTRSLSPLVDNALKYAKSSVEVQVRTHDGRLLVSVLDDGPGTDGDPFESPTGLGLPLSQRIASAMGGQVSLTQASDPTEITIDIPIGELPTGV